MKKNDYKSHLGALEIELNSLARWLRCSGRRMVVLLEGRDTSGKGGTINAITRRMNPRQVHVVALDKPGDRERGQWYFQRYVPHLPAAGELVLFDRSWYNRAGVEKIMGYCTEEEYRRFLIEAPAFERLLVDDGILLFKYWLAVDQAQQERRFTERAEDPRKRWKLSPVDLEARRLYREYGGARDAMFAATHRPEAPWVVVDFNDQRLGRLNLIRHLLEHTPDLQIPVEPIELPPLGGEPAVEQYTGPVRPIESYY